MRLEAIDTHWVIKRVEALGHRIAIRGNEEVAVFITTAKGIESEILVVDFIGFLEAFIMEPEPDFDHIILNHAPLCGSTDTTGKHVDIPAN